MQKKRSRLPRNVWVMSATSLLNDISSEMLLNLIPFFLANILGVRTAVIGLIEGLAETTASLLPASLIAGLLWQGLGAWTGFGPSAPFFFGALMALLAGLLFARLVR